ncbi:MAG: major capsid protein [Acidimicrobiales bacterium]
MSPGGAAAQNVSGRHLGWDIFDKTRLIAEGRAPGTGPATVQRKSVGHVSAVAYRAHEKITLLHEEIFRTRPLGQQFGVVDLNGQNYINNQIGYLTQRFRNSREFMISRMLRGGFGVLQTGESWVPVEKGAGTFDVDYNIPSTHLTQLDMGTGSDIIGTSWDNAAAPIIGDVLAVNKAFERLHGRPLRHIFINSTMFANLLANTELKNVGGTAYRIFDSLSARQMKSEEGIPDSGFDVVFRGLPLQTFHVYDGVLNVNQNTDSDTVANTSLFIPDNNAIFLPEPSNDWVGWINASEYVKENVMDAGRQVFGFHSWSTNTIDPAGIELKMLDNGLPVLYVPKCVAYGTCVF